jgi:hypothetical protein
MLEDVVTKDKREVDVVWRGVFQDIEVVVGFEVIDWKRPASVTWVEQQIEKHSHLPTHRLVLVSWSGFSQAAQRKASSRPEVILADLGQQAFDLRHLSLIETKLTPRGMVLVVKHSEGVEHSVTVPADMLLFLETGEVKGLAIDLANEIVHNNEIVKKTLAKAVECKNPSEFEHFFIEGPLPLQEYWLRWEETGELHAVVGVRVTGDVNITAKPLDLAYRTFIEMIFGYGSVATIQGELLLVTTQDADGNLGEAIARIEGTHDPILMKPWEEHNP